MRAPANCTDDELEDALREYTRQRQAVLDAALPYREELDRRLALERLAQHFAESPEGERMTAAMVALDDVTRQDVLARAERWAAFRTEPDPLPEPVPERRRRFWQ